MATIVRLPIHPRPRPVEDPAAEPLPAARHEIGPATTLEMLLPRMVRR